jgi:hypothetical protein
VIALRTNHSLHAVLLGWACIYGSGMQCLAADEGDLVRQRLRQQEQAQAIAEELVASVLDTQLLQLSENGLQSSLVYRDVQEMRGQLSSLAEHEMPQIVELLAAAQSAPVAERQSRINQAREKIRNVVVKLVAERQRLYRRMQVANLSVEARQLNEMLSKIHKATRSLTERQSQPTEQLALAAVEDQADVNKLFYQLTASLNDVSTWNGPAAAAAANGLRVLRVTHVEQQLQAAAAGLDASEFASAADSQQLAIRGLAALIEKLEEAQGNSDADRQAGIELIRELIIRQSVLRDATRVTDINERSLEGLIERETNIHKDVGELTKALAAFAATASLVEQAKTAAFDATASLFESKIDTALNQQANVVSNLAQLESVLRRGGEGDNRNWSAAELAEYIARLETLALHVTKSLKPLQALATPADDADRASRLSTAARELSSAQQIGQFRSSVAVRLSNAQEAVAGQGSLAEVISEIKRLDAEVSGELADTRRRHKAVELGELARAAEALERAGAASAEIARRVAAAANAPLESDQWAVLYQENSNAAAVAERIAVGIESSASNAAQILADTKVHFANAARFLNLPENQGRARTPAMCSECAASAKQASEQLAAAAAELRLQQLRAASELEAIASDQFAEADAVRMDVHKAAEAMDTEAVELLEALELARLQLVDATIDHTRAEGRDAAANALQHGFHLAQLQRSQLAADRAAEAWLSGSAHNPLDAAYQQQLVADSAIKHARTMPPQFGRLLTQAAESAREAARETINGSAPKADRARRQTFRLLGEALNAANAEAKTIDQEPTDKLDAKAQQSVGDKLVAARKLLDEAPLRSAATKQIVQLLATAETATKQAVQQIDRGEQESAVATQRSIREAIAESSQRITDLLQALSLEQANNFREQAASSQKLIEQASKIDPAAAADMAHAHAAAERGSQSSDDPERIAQFAETTWEKTRQAASNLAVRSQALAKDRELAQLMGQLAQQQQNARNTIAEAAEQLREAEPGDNSPTQLAAAQSLLQAQKRFAKAQSATGEGAAEVSGQVEVANQPIREGLEIASRLNQYSASEETAENSEGSEKSGDKPSAGDGKSGDGKSGDGKSGEKKSTANNDDQKSQKSDSQSSSEKSSANGQPPAEADSTELGTGLVPSTPQITAKQIAGPEANAAAAKMAAAMKGEGKGEGAPGEGESENPGEGSPSASAKKGGGTKGGKAVANQKGNDGELEKGNEEKSDNRAKGSGGDAVAGGSGGKGVEGEAWFAKLPPSVQAAIQAKSRGKAPKGYEERLRRYFDGVD